MNDQYEVLEEEGDVDLSEVNIDLPEASKKNRKRRSSSVPYDYDPVPAPHPLNDGHARPSTTCWVNKSIARPLQLADLHSLWGKPLDDMGEQDRKFRFLASIVVLVNGDYYVKRKDAGRWNLRKSTSEVISVVMLDWGRDQTLYHISKSCIEAFFATREFIVLDDIGYIPGAGDFVMINGKRHLNEHYQPPMSYMVGAVASLEFEALFELIVRNLLNVQDGETGDMMDEIFGNQPTAVKWFFHWIASQYQRPGNVLPTALWLLGRSQGVGKGLFASGMHRLLGGANVKNVSAEEFKGRWTDFAAGATLLILDEIDFGSRREFYDKTKRLIGNESIAVSKRNVGDRTLPMVAHFLFTTNNTNPLAIEKEDRRHTFFETSASSEAQSRAREFYELGEAGISVAWQGLAELLHHIDIDDALISRAFNTEVKERMVDGNVSPIEEWLNNEATQREWPVGHFAPVEWLRANYLAWARDNAFAGCATSSYFGRELQTLIVKSFVSKEERKLLTNGTRPRGHVRLDQRTGFNFGPVSELPCVVNWANANRATAVHAKVGARLGSNRREPVSPSRLN